MRGLERYLNDVWYGERSGTWLRPLGALYGGAMRWRRRLYDAGLLARYRAPCPVIVVGNFTVGGAGKTPLVIELVRRLSALNLTVGVNSRGYGGQVDASAAQRVTPDSLAAQVGDEPLLIARRTNAVVAVCPNRRLAAECVLEHGAQVIVADDGLQHLALARDLNIVVVDGERRLGNRRCLPAGPLRGGMGEGEPVDLVVLNGGLDTDQPRMTLRATHARPLAGGESIALTTLGGQTVHAVAGIGHPSRFFAMLRGFGIDVIEHPFSDHAALDDAQVSFDDDRLVLMTEKDAVRFARAPHQRCYDVPVDALLDEAAALAVDNLLRSVV